MKTQGLCRPVHAASRTALVAGILGVVAAATVSLADPIPFPGGCRRGGECPDVYAPVICDNGRIYSNACVAHRACATGCVPYAEVR